MKRFLNAITNLLAPLIGISICGGFIAGFIIYGVRPKGGILFFEGDSLVLMPFLLPLFLVIVIYTIILITTTINNLCYGEKQNTKSQLLLLMIVGVGLTITIGLILITWNNGYWDKCLSKDNAGIFEELKCLFVYLIENVISSIIIVIIDVILIVLLMFFANKNKKKYIKNYLSFIMKVEILSILMVIFFFILNLTTNKIIDVKMFCISFNSMIVLMIPAFSTYANTCRNCYCYKCGKTLIRSETVTEVDYNDFVTVSKEKVKIDGNESYTVVTTSPRSTTTTVKTYKCNSCNVVTSSPDFISLLLE